MAYTSPILSLFLAVVSLSMGPATLLSQDTSAAIARCVPQLMPLAACGPFVQGGPGSRPGSPAQACCDGLKQIYSQQPQCLCVVLNNTDALSSLPINTSLALQLPVLCSLQLDISVCSSGLNGPVSPASQVSLGSTGPNSTTAVNSTITAFPVTSPPNNVTSQDLAKSGGIKLKSANFDFANLVMVVAVITSLLI